MSKTFTINTLYNTSNREIVKQLVTDQIKLIDTKIQNAHQAGFNTIEHELPTNFAINNMDNMDSQILIYSEILEAYKRPIDQGGKGFDNTSIDVGPRTHLIIKWLNGMDEEERARRKQLIMDCTVAKQATRNSEFSTSRRNRAFTSKQNTDKFEYKK